MKIEHVSPFIAAYYSSRNLEKISELAIPNLDSTEKIWGHGKSALAFRNVLVGTAQERGVIWRRWFASREFERSSQAVYFVVCQKFVFAGNKFERWALLGSVDINSPRLYIHENVYPEGVEQARNGALACQADLAPIFIGCEKNKEKTLRSFLQTFSKKRSFLYYYEDRYTHHIAWKVTDEASIKKISKIVNGSNLFLLDGHHRLMAAKENLSAGHGDGKILGFISPMSNKELVILPVHRSVTYPRWLVPEQMFSDLKKLNCHLKEIKNWRPDKLSQYIKNTKRGGPKCFLLHSNSKSLWQLSFRQEKKNKIEKITVRRLENDIFKKHPDMQIFPTQDLEAAQAQLASGQAQAAFFLPKLTAENVQGIAKAQEVFPQKSTFFYPKPALGLVCRIWETKNV